MPTGLRMGSFANLLSRRTDMGGNISLMDGRMSRMEETLAEVKLSLEQGQHLFRAGASEVMNNTYSLLASSGLFDRVPRGGEFARQTRSLCFPSPVCGWDG
jgi:hypothetical protein